MTTPVQDFLEPFAAAFIDYGTNTVVRYALTVSRGKKVSGTQSRLWVPDAAITIAGSYRSKNPVDIVRSGATDGSEPITLATLPGGSGIIPVMEFAPKSGEGIQVYTSATAGHPVEVILRVIPMPYSS